MLQVRTPERRRMRGDVQAQALGGFQIAAFETGEKETPGGALFGQGDGGSVGGFLAGAGAADDDAGGRTYRARG